MTEPPDQDPEQLAPEQQFPELPDWFPAKYRPQLEEKYRTDFRIKQIKKKIGRIEAVIEKIKGTILLRKNAIARLRQEIYFRQKVICAVFVEKVNTQKTVELLRATRKSNIAGSMDFHEEPPSQ